MDKQLQAFFGAAKQVSLTTEERAKIRQNVVRASASERQQSPMAVLQSAQAMHLSSREKDEVFDHLFQHMRRHPVGGASSFSWRHLFSLQRLTAVATCAVFLFGMGGTAVYADEAMPDETLYPVKVYFNEPVRELLLFTNERRTEWHLEKVRRRMDEMRHLAHREELPPGVGQLFTERLSESVTRFEEKIAVLEEVEGSAELITKYEEILAAHEDALARVEAGEAPPAIHEAIRAIHDKHKQAFGDTPPPRRVEYFREQLQKRGPKDIRLLRERLEALPSDNPVRQRVEERLDQRSSFSKEERQILPLHRQRPPKTERSPRGDNRQNQREIAPGRL